MNLKQIEDKIKTGVILVGFNAAWCEPCFAQKPIIKRLSKHFKGQAVVIDLDVDDNRDSALKFGITSIPTSILYKDGREVKRFIGLQETEILSKAITRSLAARD
jgi:thioredoxin 1